MSETEAFVFPSAAIHGNKLVKSLLSYLEIDVSTPVKILTCGNAAELEE